MVIHLVVLWVHLHDNSFFQTVFLCLIQLVAKGLNLMFDVLLNILVLVVFLRHYGDDVGKVLLLLCVLVFNSIS